MASPFYPFSGEIISCYGKINYREGKCQQKKDNNILNKDDWREI